MRNPFPGRTADLDGFAAEAWPRDQVWRLVLGVVLTAAIVLAAVVVAVVLFYLAGGPAAAYRLTAEGGPAATIFAMTVPVLIVPALALTLRLLHGRPIRSVFGAERRINWRHFRNAALVSGFAGLAMAAVSIASGQTHAGIAPADWLRFLPLMLVLLFCQVAAEELAFRGYLMQQLGSRFRSRAIWWVAPALIFGALHLDFGTYGPNAWLIAAAAALIGLIAGDLVARTGNLGAAIGLHFGNNFFALLIVGIPGPASGLALRLSNLDLADTAAVRAGLLVNIAALILAYALWLVWLARRRRLHSPGAGTS